jgi:hypothetical protein
MRSRTGGRGHPRARFLHRVVSVVRLDLKQYEELFNEKLDLFAPVLKEQPVTWQGALRPPLEIRASIRRRNPAADDLDRRRRYAASP